MTHAECDSLLVELSYGELAADVRREVAEHLAGCAECSRSLEDIRRTLTAVRSMPAEEPSTVGVDSLLMYAEQQAARMRERRGLLPEWLSRALFTPGWALAGVAVVVGLASWALVEMTRPGPIAESQVGLPAAPVLVPAELAPPARTAQPRGEEAIAQAAAAPRPIEVVEPSAGPMPAAPDPRPLEVVAPAGGRRPAASRASAEGTAKAAARSAALPGAAGGRGIAGADALLEVPAAPAASAALAGADADRAVAGKAGADAARPRDAVPAPAAVMGSGAPAVEKREVEAATAADEEVAAEAEAVPAPPPRYGPPAAFASEDEGVMDAAPSLRRTPVAPAAPSAPPPAVRARKVDERAAAHANKVARAAEEAERAEAIFQRAQAAARAERLDAALALFLEVADRHPRSRLAPDALLAAVRLQEARGRIAERDALIRRLLASYAGSDAARQLQRESEASPAPGR